MASYNEISVSTLARLVGTPDCPVLLGVRIDEDFSDSPQMIPGALRYSFLDVEQLEGGMTLYNAFYRWARDATEESHDWPAALSKA